MLCRPIAFSGLDVDTAETGRLWLDRERVVNVVRARVSHYSPVVTAIFANVLNQRIRSCVEYDPAGNKPAC